MKQYRSAILLNNPEGLFRKNEPVITPVKFMDQEVVEESIVLYDNNGNVVPVQIIDKEVNSGYLKSASIVFLSSFDENELVKKYILHSGTKSSKVESKYPERIKQLEVTQEDGFRRLDTGYYILELCKGTGDGTAYGKWGIRYFEAKDEGINLIKDYSNAIGGFYGPFFTPKNGLINPPEHTVVDITVEEEGPLYCRYRFDGQVPDGLDYNLREKKFSIYWEFFYNSPMIRRKYDIDDFATTVDGSPVINKITVGDEFESGQGNRVFNRFESYGKTHYREGDYYAKILYDGVYKLLNEATEDTHPNIKHYRDSIGAELNDVSWDYFWRLFCVKEGILSNEEIKEHISDIIPEAHELVYNSERYNDVKVNEKGVNVNDVPEQTIFAMNANKTAHINDTTGYKMVWHTNNVVSKYQIVQRDDSGWVNWGTNGENEYPELPTGSIITSGYGQFENWEQYADSMEKGIVSKQGMIKEHKS